MINLTAAYAPFVNGGKKIEPKLISRIQAEEENNFPKKMKCIIDKFINEKRLTNWKHQLKEL